MTIHADGLEYGYSCRSRVFDELSVTFGPGKTMLLGPNGAGKSTLLKLLSGVLHPAGGALRLGDQVVSSAVLRRRVAFMPQDVAPLAGLTVLEAVRYAGWLGG